MSEHKSKIRLVSSISQLKNIIKGIDFGVLDYPKTNRVNLRVVYVKDVVALIEQLEKQLQEKYVELEATKHRDYIKGRRFQIEQLLEATP